MTKCLSVRDGVNSKGIAEFNSNSKSIPELELELEFKFLEKKELELELEFKLLQKKELELEFTAGIDEFVNSFSNSFSIPFQIQHIFSNSVLYINFLTCFIVLTYNFIYQNIFLVFYVNSFQYIL